jgi:uncharacterized protein YcfJ
MNIQWKCALGLSALLLAGQAMAAQITFYEGEGFRGRSVTSTGKGIPDFRRTGLNDRASSVVVGSGDWEVCDQVGFGGRCALLHPGNYESLSRLRMNDRISSVRRVDNRRAYDQHFVPEPYTGSMYEYRQRPGERVYEARVTDVRAVSRSERCWVERDQVDERSRAQQNNVGAKVAGAIVGGIIGHQIGKGGAAITAGGAVAGGAVGSRLAHEQDKRDERDDDLYGRKVRHCDTRFSGRPDFWDVEYVFNGVEHHVQMDGPPGRTLWVNGRGEPRQ